MLQGLTWSQIAADLHNPSSPVAQGADGSANLFTAAICKITGNQPASVCTTAPVSALEGGLEALSPPSSRAAAAMGVSRIRCPS